MGLLLWLMSAALGPAAAALFHEPQMVEIMPALGLTFLIYGVGSTHYSLAMRGIDFRSRTVAEVADAIVRGGVGVALALAGAGVWALVVGYVAGAVAMTIVVWKMVEWQPRWRVGREHMRRLLGFGGALTGVGIMGAFLNQFDNAVIGRVLGPTELGLYSIATRLPYLLIISLAAATGQVLFPAFAALDGKAMVRGFLTSLRYTAMVALPLTAVLITLAAPIMLAIFGPKWRGAIAATQVLCLWALMSPISMVCGNAIKSRGRAGLLLMLAVPQAIVLIVGSLVFVHQGIVAVSWVQAAIAIVAQVVTLWIVCRMLGIGPGGVVRSIGPPLLASAVLSGVLLGIRAVLSSPWPTVITGGIVGTVVYLGVLHLLAPDLLPSLLEMALGRRRSSGAVDPSPAAGQQPGAAQEPPAAVTRS
jgi:PST family polysaccharide transporter